MLTQFYDFCGITPSDIAPALMIKPFTWLIITGVIVIGVCAALIIGGVIWRK